MLVFLLGPNRQNNQVLHCSTAFEYWGLLLALRDFPPKKENVVTVYSPSCPSKPVWVCLWNTIEDILKDVGNQIDFHLWTKIQWKLMGTKTVTNILQNMFLSQSYRFGMTRGCVNDNRTDIFEWTVPLGANVDIHCLMSVLMTFCWFCVSAPTLEFSTGSRVPASSQHSGPDRAAHRPHVSEDGG